jgi:hypothetical protein
MYFGNHKTMPLMEKKKAKRMANCIKFVRKHLVWVKRFQYAVIVITCAAVLCFQVSKCVEKFVTKSTGTADKYVHVSRTAFPELTICPTYPYKLDTLIANGVHTKGDFYYGANWISNDSRKSPQDFYKEVVLNVDDIVKKVTIFVEQLVDGKHTLKLGPLDTICNGQTLFHTKPYYYNGDCFDLVLPDCLRNAGPLELKLQVLDKTDIFIHHFGQFLSPNSRSRVDVDTGKFVKIAINHEVVQLLSGSDFGTCVNNYGKSKDFDDCMYTKMYQLMMDKIGCTVPWLIDKSNICVEPTKQKQALKLYQNNRRNQHDVCPNSCLFTNMYFGPPVTGINVAERSHYGNAVFYFRRDIKMTNEYLLYTLLSMSAEIGGYVGLLLGASLVNLGSINSFLLDWCLGEEKDQTVTEKNIVKSIAYPKELLVSDQNGPDHTTPVV